MQLKHTLHNDARTEHSYEDTYNSLRAYEGTYSVVCELCMLPVRACAHALHARYEALSYCSFFPPESDTPPPSLAFSFD